MKSLKTFKENVKPYIKGLVKLTIIIVIIFVVSTISFNCGKTSGYDRGFDEGYDSGVIQTKNEVEAYNRALSRLCDKALTLQENIRDLQDYIRSLTPFEGVDEE